VVVRRANGKEVLRLRGKEFNIESREGKKGRESARQQTMGKTKTLLGRVNSGVTCGG